MANTISAKNEVKNQARRTAENVLEETSNSLRNAAQDAGHNVREFLHEKSEQAAELRKSAEEKIVRHPLESIAIAALGGLVIGALFSRR